MIPSGKHVLVIGAGVIGASIAYHLQRAGARVTVIDSNAGGGIATRHSWAWINASWGNPEPYFRLRHKSMQLWRQLGASLPALGVNWCGGLLWDISTEELRDYVKQHRAWGYDIRAVDRAEIAQIEPALAMPPDFAVHVTEEGYVEPVAATHAFLQAAQRAGMTLITDQSVVAIDLKGNRVVGALTEQGPIAAEGVVIAAGTETARLAETTGIKLPMSAPPGLLVTTGPAPRLLNGLVMSPSMHIRQMSDGRFIAGADFGGGDLAEGASDGQARVAAQNLLAAMSSLFKGRPQIELDHYTIGHRPMPADGFPAVGCVDGIEGLSVAVTHSGITLAPVIGAGLAAEIMTGERDALLLPYGPNRFA